jgi:ATP-dependent Clp protease ATP-binding subunit ClpA
LIHKRLIDQENAVKIICEAIRRNRAGLKNPKRPVGSFIFMGPTGVGKTQLAKTLAEVMFGAEDKMIRIDMSEYMEKNSTARMIGAPPGYVGYEEGGQLTEAVRKNPYSIVLFDEIEKAHKDVFNIFLQILDDGRLTDNKGRTVDFKNTIIICTSNVGTEIIQKSNVTDPNLQKQLTALLLETFRPEFINRFDEVVVFRGLRPQDMAAISQVMIKDIEALLKEQKITLSISERAKLKLAEMGYDPVYGARPLRRIIQKEIENPLSLLMIQGTVKANLPLLVDLNQQNKFVFYDNSKAQPPQTPSRPQEKEPADPKNDNIWSRDNARQESSDDHTIQTSTSE